MSLLAQTENISNLINDTTTSEETIQQVLSDYINVLNSIQRSSNEVEKSMQAIAKAIRIENCQTSQLASLMLGTMIENNYPANYIDEIVIALFKDIENRLAPLLKALEGKPKDVEEYDFIQSLFENENHPYKKEYEAINALDAFYQWGVTVFSSSEKTLQKAKDNLKELPKYSNFCEGAHWLSTLLNVFIEEPIIVIELETRKGFIGNFTGIVDNFHLHLALKCVPDINENITLTSSQIATIIGTGPQTLDESVVGKWDMYGWKMSKYLDNLNSQDVTQEPSLWIWGEGMPSDIPKFENYRVILLGKPTITRHISVLRTFKCLRAEVTVEIILTEQEITEWMEKFKKS